MTIIEERQFLDFQTLLDNYKASRTVGGANNKDKISILLPSNAPHA